jgi:hypothetical protein
MNNDDFEKRFLAKGKELYEQGDKAEILYCLSFCIRNRVPTPEWLRQAFGTAYHAAVMRNIKSWDEVFGKPLKKGKHLTKAKRDLMKGPIIASRVREQARAGKPIDKELYNDVGKDCGSNGTDAEQLYSDLKKDMASMNDEAIINRTSNFGYFRKLK